MVINITRTSELLSTTPAHAAPAGGREGVASRGDPWRVPADEKGVTLESTPGGVPVAVESPTRAVVVRVDGEQAHQFERQCLAYLDRHGLRLVGFADSDGAMRMVAAGTADLVVAAREQHLGRPWFVRIVADEARESGRTDPRRRRARRSEVNTTVNVMLRRPLP